jgi:hypothetical protein
LHMHTTDLDERGISPRDKINGDELTLVGFKKKKKRRVLLSEYLKGEFANPQTRRNMGWIMPSLDGDPAHPEILADLLRSQANAKRKAENIAKAKEENEQRERKRRERRAKKMAAAEGAQ